MRLPSPNIPPIVIGHLRRWRLFFRDKNGFASLDFLIILPFLLFFLLVGMDFMRWQMTVSSAQNVAEAAIQQMAQEGGMDEPMAQQMRLWMRKTHLDPEQWSIAATPVSQPGESLTLILRSRVPFYAFSLFGMHISVPVEVSRVGISQKQDRLSPRGERAKRASWMAQQRGAWP